MSIYKTLDMIEPYHWRLCVGTTDLINDAFILPPNGEDCCDRWSNVLCSCDPFNKKIRQNYYDCSDKCPTCFTMWKDMIAFNYLPISNQLSLLMSLNIFCKKMLTMWNQKQRWIGKDVMETHHYVKEF